ncbi:MAG: formate dehydrogenase accessory sulfurtransferase FdhD [Bacillota bacterium]
MTDPVLPTKLRAVRGSAVEEIEDLVVAEYDLAIQWHGRRLATLVCTPQHLEELVAGFLLTAGFIDRLEQVDRMTISEEVGVADVETTDPDPGKVVRTEATWTGCGGRPAPLMAGPARVSHGGTVARTRLLELARRLQVECPVFRTTGGTHVAAAARPAKEGFQVLREDIGRHNAVDKVAGYALFQGQVGSYDVLAVSGRVSSDMLIKASRLAVPVVLSRSAPTERAVSMAKEAGITLVGFCRGERFNVYTHPYRIDVDAPA